MKPFLSKIFLFLLVQSLIVICMIGYLDNKFGLPFVSNSISYNAKAKFLAENRDLFEKSRIKVIGSSMSLNNIDCQMLSDSLKVPVINLAAWKMKLNDFSNFDIWKKGNVVIMNMHFTDFGRTSLIAKKGFPFEPGRLTNFTNILKDFKTYSDHIENYGDYSGKKIRNFYNSLYFDSTGTVVFTDHDQFIMDDHRWEYELNEFSEMNLRLFLNDVKAKAPLVDKLVICFTPSIVEKITMEKKQAIIEIEQALRQIPNVLFINNFGDSIFNKMDFVDYCHFSKSGTRKNTTIILSRIRDMKILE